MFLRIFWAPRLKWNTKNCKIIRILSDKHPFLQIILSLRIDSINGFGQLPTVIHSPEFIAYSESESRILNEIIQWIFFKTISNPVYSQFWYTKIKLFFRSKSTKIWEILIVNSSELKFFTRPINLSKPFFHFKHVGYK